MVKYTALEFDHLVEFTQDNTVFAAARDVLGRLRIFLIHLNSGHVYSRNGKVDSWEQLCDIDRLHILGRVSEARANRIPVYTINGSHNS